MKQENSLKMDKSQKKYTKRLTAEEMGKVIGQAIDKAKAEDKKLRDQEANFGQDQTKQDNNNEL